MAKFHFFTDIDLLDTVDTSGKGQPSSEAFGSNTTTDFLVSSVHRSNSLQNPFAYAVATGKAFVYPSDLSGNILTNPAGATHFTIVLRPATQPSEYIAGFPLIKYFIYRGIKKDSIVNGTALIDGSSDWITSIIASAKSDVDKSINVILPDDSSSGSQSFIDLSFEGEKFKEVVAGDSMGQFDASRFSFEVVLADIGFHPTLELTGKAVFHKITVSVTGSSDADLFIERNSKEQIKRYMDPCAFYGSLYGLGIGVKRSDKTQAEFQKTEDIYNNILVKFYNKNKVYIDIRNEHNFSFNYYKVVSDDYYTSYLDTVNIETENVQGKLATSFNYYTNGWPLLALNKDHFTGGNNKGKNSIHVRLPKGNNDRPLIFIAYGTEDRGNTGRPFKVKKIPGRKRFITPGTYDTEYYLGVDLMVPNIPSDTTPVSSYIRLIYVRKAPEVVSKTSVPTSEVQPLDYLFAPNAITPPQAIIDKVASESELYIQNSTYQNRYVNFNETFFDDIRFLGEPRYARDQSNITLFIKASQTEKFIQNADNTIDSGVISGELNFLSYYDKKILSSKDKIPLGYLQSEVVDNGSKKVLYFNDNNDKSFFRFKKPSSEDFIAIVIEKNDFNNVILTAARNSANFTEGFEPRLVVKNPRHRDSSSPEDDNFTTLSLFLKGFKVESNSITTQELDLNLTVNAKRNDHNGNIYNVYISNNVNINSFAVSTLMPYKCPNIYFDSGTPAKSPGLIGDARITLNEVGTLVENIYKEELIDFITGLYKAGMVNQSDTPSARLYSKVFQHFILLDKSGLELTFPLSGGNEPGAEFKYYPPQFIMGTDPTPFVNSADLQKVQLNYVGGKLAPSVILDEGFLIEAAVYFSIWKISEDLRQAYRIINIPNLLTDYAASLQTDLENTYPFFNNLLVVLEKNGLPSPDKWKNTIFNESNITDFHRALHPKSGSNKQIEEICKSWYKVHGNPISCLDLRNILTELNLEKRKYLLYYTECVYKALGGKGTNLDIILAATGDGSITNGLFGLGTGIFSSTGTGAFMYCYSYTSNICKTPATDPTVKTIKPDELIKYNNIKSSPLSGTSQTLHIGKYGINDLSASDVEDFLVVKSSKGRITNNSFKFKGELSYSFQNDSPSRWEDDSSKLIGVWDNNNKNLTVSYKNGISVVDNIDYTIGDGEDEKATCIIAFNSESSLIIPYRYSKSFEDLFPDDYFQLRPTKKAALWTSSTEDEANLKQLVNLLKDSDVSIEVNLLTGGFVGQKIVPPPFIVKPPENPYKVGDRVVFEDGGHNRIYRSNKATSGNFKPADWDLVTFAPSGTYSAGDLISEKTAGIWTIYRANQSFSLSTFNPSEWTKIAEEYKNSTSYTEGVYVVHEQQLYECLIAVDGSNTIFEKEKWILASTVKTDTRYEYNPDSTPVPWQPKEIREVSSPPGEGTLLKEEYARLRYSLADIRYDETTKKVSISIESYTSPLRSRLDKQDKPIEKFEGKDVDTNLNNTQIGFINNHTIYHQDNNTDAKWAITGGILASYNQVLSSLRCMGLLEGILDRIDEAATDAAISSKIAGLKAAASTRVQTTSASTNVGGMVQLKYLAYSDYIFLK